MNDRRTIDLRVTVRVPFAMTFQETARRVHDLLLQSGWGVSETSVINRSEPVNVVEITTGQFKVDVASLREMVEATKKAISEAPTVDSKNSSTRLLAKLVERLEFEEKQIGEN